MLWQTSEYSRHRFWWIRIPVYTLLFCVAFIYTCINYPTYEVGDEVQIQSTIRGVVIGKKCDIYWVRLSNGDIDKIGYPGHMLTEVEDGLE